MTEEKRKKVEELVQKFKSDMADMYGVFPLVIYETENAKIPLDILYNVVNELLVYNTDAYHKTIKDKSRKQTLINHRQVFYKIANEMGYGYTHVARFLGFDHATAIHSKKKVEDMLTTNDLAISKIYKDAKTKIKENYEANLSDTGETQTQSKSAILAV